MKLIEKINRELQIVNFEISMLESKLDDLAGEDSAEAIEAGETLGKLIENRQALERNLYRIN